jgi:hypothetical protein
MPINLDKNLRSRIPSQEYSAQTKVKKCLFINQLPFKLSRDGIFVFLDISLTKESSLLLCFALFFLIACEYIKEFVNLEPTGNNNSTEKMKLFGNLDLKIFGDPGQLVCTVGVCVVVLLYYHY